MWHLPYHKQKVYVWPTPGLAVPSGPPHPALISAPIPMAAKGQVVIWDEFRHKQYLAGELQFHDPRSEEEQKKDPIEDAHLGHVHKAVHPPHLKKRLHELADEHDAVPENKGKKAFRPELTEEEAKAYAEEKTAKEKARAEKAERQKAEAEKKPPATPAKPEAAAKKE